ncbi:MAG: T9SS type A sorting domain-containing protein, partial [Crocinitomicaceae bacterium]
TLTTTFGCDSVIQKTLIVYPQVPVQSLADVAICAGDSVAIFGAYQSVAGPYFDTLTTTFGCDSVIQRTLIVYPQVPMQTLTDVEVCAGDSIAIFGMYQSIAGSYFDTLSTTFGCDSVLTQDLIVNPIPIVSLDDFSDDSLCTYSQPISLPNGVPSGGTYSGTGVAGGLFDPSLAGIGTHVIYYSYIDGVGCSSIDSSYISVSGCLGIHEDLFSNLSIRPNPFNSQTTIDFGRELNNEYVVQVVNVLGEIVQRHESIVGDQMIMKRNDLSAGVYLLRLTRKADHRAIFTERLVIH